jgi:hypothetical protein
MTGVHLFPVPQDEASADVVFYPGKLGGRAGRDALDGKGSSRFAQRKGGPVQARGGKAKSLFF